jgi:hypothetical protein
MRPRAWPFLLAMVAVLASGAVAKDDDEAMAERRAKAAVKRFKHYFKSKDVDKKCDALLVLSRTQHPLTVAEMRKVLMKDRDAEVRDACVMVLGDMTEVADEAGAAIRDLLELCVRKRRKEDPEVLKSAGASIGKLGYKGAHEGLLWLLDHNDQWVVVNAIRAIAQVGDRKALPKLYDMAVFQGTGYSWSTGEVTVDTGAAGDADQKAAEALWKKKYGHVKPRKAGPTVVKLYMRHLRECVEKLTGEKFESAAEFKAWIDAHPVECGLKPPPKEKR